MRSRINRAVLSLPYNAKGNHRQAEKLLAESVALFEKTIGLEHEFGVKALGNLAFIYLGHGDYAKAEHTRRV